MATPPAPMGEALELLGNAARAYLDGPLAFLRGAADRMAQPGYDADAATTDVAGYGLRLAQAWFGGFNAAVGAIALAAMPPGEDQRFVVTVPAAPVTRTVRIKSKTWTWMLDDEPADVVMALHPPLGLAAEQTRIGVIVKPPVPEPSWELELELKTLGQAEVSVQHVTLDASTQLPPGTAWPTGP